MAIETNITEIIQTIESLNLPIPSWGIQLIVILLILNLIYEPILKKILELFQTVIKYLRASFYSPETKAFVDIRNVFVRHLEYEVDRLNREADWNDVHYTELEAEVEIDSSLDFDISSTKNPIVLMRSLFHIVVSFIRISPASKIQKNLIEAINKSKSRAFLVIGDPGSGKTVSLRHLFLEIAKKCTSSKNRGAIVPVYLNLKRLNVELDEVNADVIHDWIIEELRINQDRTVHEFIDKNFEQMLKDGNFFFLFDSFDEIPAVMDAQEEQEAVNRYAIALDGFLHSQHRCRGLVSSRPYRKPKIFIGQRMEIRPLSTKRIKKALYKYMEQEVTLANRLWQELVQNREDMLYIAQNPFYLGLLSRYSKENKKLPERHYDLFEHFVQNRAKTDEKRLSSFGLSPNELINASSMLAYAMTNTPHIGLESNTDQLSEITGMVPKKLELLLHALAFSKLGRLSQEEPGKARIFSFVHRRFHEYFCARYLRQNPNIAPFENLAADDRWREILVLLCEVLPTNNILKIFDTARLALTTGTNASYDSNEQRNAVETIRFLRDGFHNRIADIPIDIRILCSSFIQKQLKSENLLDQKRAIEGVSLADDESVYLILESALKSNSAWLRETALRSCRILRTVPEEISKAIRNHLYLRYKYIKIIADYSFYSIFFSSKPALQTFKSFSKILLVATLFQMVVYSGTFIYGFIYDEKILNVTLILIIMGIFVIFYGLIRGSRKSYILGYFTNPWLFTGFYGFILFIVSSKYFSIMYFLLFLLNIFLISIKSDYPQGISAWLSYPVKVGSKIAKNFKKLICLFLSNWKEAIKYIIITVLIGGFSILFITWSEKGYGILQSQNYSIFKIYNMYGLRITIAILLMVLLYGTLFILTLFSTIVYIVKIIIDQSKLTKLYFFSEKRPLKASDAIQILQSFKLDVGKYQYASALFKWIPTGADPHVLIEEANKNSDAVRDKLYQLAEIWEDSMRRKK